jgi:hypothetical protein
MFEKVRESLKEVIKISEECPEKFQNKCFEVLLEAVVRGDTKQEDTYKPIQNKEKVSAPFFTQNDIKQEEWQNVYHFDGNEYSIIVQDLKEKTVAKKQIKLALLLGVKGLLDNNETNIEKESLIAICKNYSTYDPKNFAFHMKKNKHLFLQKDGGWTLTIPGQQEAAIVIKELA